MLSFRQGKNARSPMSSKSAGSKNEDGEGVFQDGDSRNMASNILKNHKKNTAKFFLIFFGFSAMTTVALASFMMIARHSINSIFNYDMQLQEFSSNIRYYDEVLTMSARMGAFTGDRKWVDRYLQFVDPIDSDIKSVQSFVPEIADEFFESTDAANQRLIELETLALDIVNSTSAEKNLSLAQSYLFGEEYSSMKSILLDGLDLLEEQIDFVIEARKDSSAAMALYAVIVAISISVCSFVLGFSIMRLIRVHSVEEEKMLFKAMVRYYNMRRRQQQNQGPGPASGGPNSSRTQANSSPQRKILVASSTAKVLATSDGASLP